MNISFVAGRDITELDSYGAPGVVIINKTYAERYFKGEKSNWQTYKIER